MSEALFVWIEGIDYLNPVPERLKKIFLPKEDLADRVFLDYSHYDGIGPIDIYPVHTPMMHSWLKFAVQVNRTSGKLRKIIFGPEYQKDKLNEAITEFTNNLTIPLTDKYVSKKNTIVYSTTETTIANFAKDPTFLQYFEYKQSYN